MKDFRYSITYYYNEPIHKQEGKTLPAIFLAKRRDAKTRTGNKHNEGGEHNERLGNCSDNYRLWHKNLGSLRGELTGEYFVVDKMRTTRKMQC